MIFVTVGSQKFPFNRLIKKVDQMVQESTITEEVLIQTGASDYTPSHCRYQAFYDKEALAQLMDQCDILITHGGVGTMIEAVRKGKKIIAVPRLARYKEHVDDHQMELTQRLLDQEEALIPFFSPENRLTYAQYVEICRRNWDACLRRQWLSGFWGEEPSSFPLQPGWQKDFPALSPSGASALAALAENGQQT